MGGSWRAEFDIFEDYGQAVTLAGTPELPTSNAENDLLLPSDFGAHPSCSWLARGMR